MIVAMQIRARALLKQTDYVAMTVLGDLVGLISSQACSSSSFQSADDHTEVVKMCWHRYEDRSNICTRRRGVSS